MTKSTPVKGSSADAGTLIVPRKGLQLPQRLAFDRWFEIGQQLSAVTTSSAWCLGDWLVYGETTYEGRYREAVARTMLDYGTLRNYAWVARRFALSRRRDTLTFGHHAEVAAMSEPEQEYWLGKAEELSWSRNQLRREVRASLRQRGHASVLGQDGGNCEPSEEGTGDHASLSAKPKSVDRLGHTLQVGFSREQLDICQAAASIRGISLEDWVLRTLKEAAKDAVKTSQLPASFS